LYLPPLIQSSEGGYALGSVSFCQLDYSKIVEWIFMKFRGGVGSGITSSWAHPSQPAIYTVLAIFWRLDSGGNIIGTYGRGLRCLIGSMTYLAVMPKRC